MGIGHWTERSASFAAILLLVAIAWGALAFGAVYPWAYWPLALLSVVASVIGIAANRSRLPDRSRALAIALIVLGVAIALQLLPLPNHFVSTISPSPFRLITRPSMTRPSVSWNCCFSY